MDIEDIRWNYFTASHQNGRINLYPGEGGYRWEDICAYLRQFTWDNTAQAPESKRRELDSLLERIPQNCGTTYVYNDDHIGNRLVCLYAYDSEHQAEEMALLLFTSLSATMIQALGLHGVQVVDVPDVSDQTAETLGRIEMRIALLHEEVGFSRKAPVLWPSDLKLLGLYNAVKENFEAVKAIAMLPVFTEEIRHEAASLAYAIAGDLRPDLYAQARAEGVPLLSDPYHSWVRKTDRSREW